MTDPPPDSFDAFFPALHRRSYAVAYRLLGSPGTAEDIAQETMARTYVRWSRLQGDRTGWCVRVAVNLAMDHLRTTERDRRRQRQLIVLDTPVSADPYAAERVDLYAALRGLPRRQREIVALRWIGDLSEQQTADALAISVGSVKSQASRGLEALRHQLNPTPLTRSNHV